MLQSAAAEQLAAADSRVAELQEQVRAAESRAVSSAPRPPVMPGPGVHDACTLQGLLWSYLHNGICAPRAGDARLICAHIITLRV